MVDIDFDADDDVKKIEKIDTSPARIMAHIDVIRTCHFPIADNKENRKIFEEHICTVCAKIYCTGRGRCRATDKTFAQLNLLTPLVSYRDEGSVELGIEGFDRVMTIGEALRPFNTILADYFDEEGVQIMHAVICISKDKDASLGKLIIPREYNVKVSKLLR